MLTDIEKEVEGLASARNKDVLDIVLAKMAAATQDDADAQVLDELADAQALDRLADDGCPTHLIVEADGTQTFQRDGVVLDPTTFEPIKPLVTEHRKRACTGWEMD